MKVNKKFSIIIYVIIIFVLGLIYGRLLMKQIKLDETKRKLNEVESKLNEITSGLYNYMDN